MTTRYRRPYSVHVFATRRTDRERQYLIVQRRARPDLDLPAFYQGVSGALEDNESFLQAAIREILEETGLQLAVLEAVGFSHRYPIKSQWRKHYGDGPVEVEDHVFTVDIPGLPDHVLSAEHTSWVWLSLADALSVLHYGNCVESLRRVDLLWRNKDAI